MTNEKIENDELFDFNNEYYGYTTEKKEVKGRKRNDYRTKNKNVLTKSELKSVSFNPDLSIVKGNRKYILIDITPSENKRFKFTYGFINFLSRYFEDHVIYLFGDKSLYTEDQFIRLKPNVSWIEFKDENEFLNYVYFSKRFYTFETQLFQNSIKNSNINLENITLFLEEDEMKKYIFDTCIIDHDIDLTVISENKGNVLSK